MNKITWLPVIGFETHYEVSNDGQVRRIKPYNGIKEGRILRPKKCGAGYCQAILYKENKGTPKLIHRLVAECFIGQIPKGLEINHKDGNKENNSVDNLEIVTRSQNNSHAVINGLRIMPNQKGNKHWKSSGITEDKVILIRKMRKEQKLTFQQISDIVGFSRDVVSGIATGRTWRHIN